MQDSVTLTETLPISGDPTRGASHGPGVRESILDATIELARTRGSTGTVTMRAVASASRRSATDIYQHFASKAALLTAARARAVGDLRARLRAATSGVDPRAAVVGWVEAYLEANPSDPWLQDGFPVGGAGTDGFRMADELFEFTGLRRCVEAMQAGTNGSAPASPAWLAWMIWATTHATLVGQPFSGEGLGAAEASSRRHEVAAWIVDHVLTMAALPTAPVVRL